MSTQKMHLYNVEYYREHRAKIKARSLAYYHAHRDQQLQKRRLSRKNDPSRARMYSLRYRRKHRAQLARKSRVRYRKLCKEA